MHEYIPYGHQQVSEDDIALVGSVLRSEWLTTGPIVEEFETAFAQKVDASYAVAVSSGTAGLHAAMFAAGITPGDEVITTPLTFAASANSIMYQGGRPVFADIHLDSYLIDPNEIKNLITKKTRALLPVDYTGQPCDLDEIHILARDHNLLVIEDACHAPGATYKNRRIGGLSDLSVFSFHPVKHITTGEGGMVTTNSEELYHRLRSFRNHGIMHTPEKGGWQYEQHFLGFNYRITDFQCALGISQLQRLDENLRRRREIVTLYQKGFQDTPGVILPMVSSHVSSAWHLFVIQFNLEELKVTRKHIYDRLRALNIGVQVHYIPVYYHPYYERLGYHHGLCPHAEYIYERILSLPLYPQLKDEDVHYVIDSVKEACM